jgi:hypothetical protein
MGDIRYQIRSSVTLEGGSVVSDAYSPGIQRVVQSDARLFRNIQAVGVVEEPIDVGDIQTPGVAIFRNLDDTNYVEIGSQQSGGWLPSNSQIGIAADGTPYMESITNSLWYPFQMDGVDGSAAVIVGQTGAAAPAYPGGWASSQILIDTDGTPYMESVTNGLWYPFQMDGIDGSAAIIVGQTGGSAPAGPGGWLPSNSQIRIAADGTPYMESVTNGLWYSCQIGGTDGSAAIIVGQTGESGGSIPGGAFYAFLKLKPGESQLLRLAVSASELYVRADTAEVNLFCLIYDD